MENADMLALSPQAEEAGRIIHRCWMTGEVIDALPDGCRPRTLTEGYAAQRAFTAASGERTPRLEDRGHAHQRSAPHQRRDSASRLCVETLRPDSASRLCVQTLDPIRACNYRNYTI